MSDLMDVLRRVVDKFRDGQYEAISYPARYMRVLAGAGAGKTETLVRRIIWLMTNYRIKPEQIVAITFTEKAGQEMKSRLMTRLEEFGLKELAQEVGKMFVGTIHSFCLDLLERYYGMGDYMLLDEKKEMAFVFKHGLEIGIEQGEGYPERCKSFIRSVNVVYDNLVDRKRLEEEAPEFYQNRT